MLHTFDPHYERKLHPTEDVDFFHDAILKPFKNVCDAVSKCLHAKGVGTEIKATSVMSSDDERKAWTSVVVNLTTSIGLLKQYSSIMERILTFFIAYWTRM